MAHSRASFAHVVPMVDAEMPGVSGTEEEENTPLVYGPQSRIRGPWKIAAAVAAMGLIAMAGSLWKQRIVSPVTSGQQIEMAEKLPATGKEFQAHIVQSPADDSMDPSVYAKALAAAKAAVRASEASDQKGQIAVAIWPLSTNTTTVTTTTTSTTQRTSTSTASTETSTLTVLSSTLTVSTTTLSLEVHMWHQIVEDPAKADIAVPGTVTGTMQLESTGTAEKVADAVKDYFEIGFGGVSPEQIAVTASEAKSSKSSKGRRLSRHPITWTLAYGISGPNATSTDDYMDRAQEMHDKPNETYVVMDPYFLNVGLKLTENSLSFSEPYMLPYDVSTTE